MLPFTLICFHISAATYLYQLWYGQNNYTIHFTILSHTYICYPTKNIFDKNDLNKSTFPYSFSLLSHTYMGYNLDETIMLSILRCCHISVFNKFLYTKKRTKTNDEPKYVFNKISLLKQCWTEILSATTNLALEQYIKIRLK